MTARKRPTRGKKRPLPQARPPVCVKGHGDGGECPVASIWHYQQKCGGVACRVVNTVYYRNRRRAQSAARKEAAAE